MNQRISLLAGVLVAQLLLIGLLSFSSGEEESASGLLGFEVDSVTGLSISDAEGHSIDLALGENGWRLGELPADSDKVLGAIESLVLAAAGWPVATSESSQERFEVTSAAFQRQVRLLGADGVLAEVFLGTAPGFRRVHARREGDDAVYAIDFAVHELPTDVDDWLSKTLFQTEEIARIQLPGGRVLSRDDAGAWSLDGAVAELEAAGRYVDRIERLSVLGLYDEDEPSGEGETLGAPAVVTVQDAQGSHTLTFRFDEGGDEYVLTSDRVAGEFTVASYIVEQILVDPEDLLLKPEAPAGAGAVPGPGPGEEQMTTGESPAES